MTSYPITTKIGLHSADDVTIDVREVFPADGGRPVRWLDLTAESGHGASHSKVELTIHAGHNPVLWQRFCDLADAWRDACLRPEPTDADLAQADEVLDGEALASTEAVLPAEEEDR